MTTPIYIWVLLVLFIAIPVIGLIVSVFLEKLNGDNQVGKDRGKTGDVRRR